MIGMIYRGDGARGLLDYLANQEGSRLLSTNLDGVTPPEFSRQIGEVRRLYFREQVAHPVAHIILRPSPGEDLTDEEWEDTAQLALERLGYDYSPYVAYLHDHGEGRHLHVATYRVNFEGRLVSDSNDRFKLMELARDLEQTYGLEVATKRNPITLTRAEIERRLRDPGREAAQQSLRDAIDQAASQHQTVRAFLSELHRLGIQANLKVARKSGAAQGITFTLPDGTTIKGSDLGKKYSLGALCNRHELRLDLKPEGPYLVASEISQREYRALERDDLAADVADPILAAATATSDFALEDLYKAGDRPVTLYLVIDPNSIKRLSDHIRIVISQIAAALTREMPTEKARHPFLLLLDEFPVFGRMKVVETALAYLRGYRVQAYLVVQHVGQLHTAYGRSESISPNCSVHIAFAPADLETARQLSQRAGNRTVHFERGSVSRRSVSTQEADSGRPLLTPDEIMRLPKGEALVLRTGTFPLRVRPQPFFKHPLRSAAARIPLPASERTEADFSHWLDRKVPPTPTTGKGEKRTASLRRLVDPPGLVP